MKTSGLSLKGVEVFCSAAQSGSVAEAAAETGLSLPAASQQIKKLEDALGCLLLDRDKRPLQVTPAGQVFLRRAREMLRQVQLAKTEMISLDFAKLGSLRIGVIDDFEEDITPRLIGKLSESLRHCDFKLFTGPSHDVEKLLERSAIDVGIFMSSGSAREGIDEYDLLIDPYVVLAPKVVTLSPGNELTDLSELQYITYDRRLKVGRQIEAQLSRLRLNQAHRIEMDSYRSIAALVAAGNSWSISTPLSHLKAHNFWGDVLIHPLPFSSFARKISLFVKSEWSETIGSDMADSIKRMLETHSVTPCTNEFPWLKERFRVADQ